MSFLVEDAIEWIVVAWSGGWGVLVFFDVSLEKAVWHFALADIGRGDDSANVLEMVVEGEGLEGELVAVGLFPVASGGAFNGNEVVVELLFEDMNGDADGVLSDERHPRVAFARFLIEFLGVLAEEGGVLEGLPMFEVHGERREGEDLSNGGEHREEGTVSLSSIQVEF